MTMSKDGQLFAKRMAILLTAAGVLALGVPQGAKGAKRGFERVEVFPAGKQGAGMRALVKLKDTNTVTVDIDRPDAIVWAAVKIVANKFDQLGRRPVVGINENAHRVQNGAIRTEDLRLSGSLNDWRDEVVTEVVPVNEHTARISVTRKLVEKTLGSNQWSFGGSNGVVERWFITQVLDEVSRTKGQTLKAPDAPVTDAFVAEDNPKDTLVFRGDKTFSASEKGVDLSGQYEWAGDTLQLTSGANRDSAKLAGDILTASNGRRWVRKSSTAQVSASSQGRETIGNAEIIKLVQAHLPDAVIAGKIRGSRCEFDLTTDGLIKLKEAGVSDAVIQAMTEAGANR